MARFVDSVPSSWSPEDAFSYMADARNFAEWDPGTERVAQVQGSGPAPDAAYDVTLRVGSRTTTFRYEVLAAIYYFGRPGRAAQGRRRGKPDSRRIEPTLGEQLQQMQDDAATAAGAPGSPAGRAVSRSSPAVRRIASIAATAAN